jgi:hypothetical protein
MRKLKYLIFGVVVLLCFTKSYSFNMNIGWKDPLFKNETYLKIFYVDVTTKSLGISNSAKFGINELSKAKDFIKPKHKQKLNGELYFGVNYGQIISGENTDVIIKIKATDKNKAVYIFTSKKTYSNIIDPKNSFWYKATVIPSNSKSYTEFIFDENDSFFKLHTVFMQNKPDGGVMVGEYYTRFNFQYIKGKHTILSL